MIASIETQCVIPVRAFTEQPYNLNWGSEVFVKVQAINVIGLSAESSLSGPSKVETYPSAPSSPSNDESTTSHNTIGISWL